MSFLAGRSVVVTGAAGGIGTALARRFAAEGARLSLLDRDGEGARALARELTDAGCSALALGCDVGSEAQCRESVESVVSARGGIDVLVNNAGITQLGRLIDTEVSVLRRVMDVNFFGAVHCTKAALPHLLARRGRIVVLSSVAGLAPLATRSGYAASKHALHGFFESLRAEHREDGLRVLMVCPSFVATRIGDSALGPDGAAAGPGARTGVRGAMPPEQLADAVLRAMRRDRRRLLVPAAARLAVALARVAPGLYERLMVARTLGPGGA